MELFTLGQGNYAERDIQEAARAFTGWSIDPDTMDYRFRRFLHDGGEKTVLGRTGKLNGDDVLDILLAQPATAEFIVGKLWREFVSPEPDAVRVQALAATFRASGYDIRSVLRPLFNQPEMVAPQPAHYLVKSPVELLIGLVRQSGGEIAQPIGAAVSVAAMGQNLFSAPNVRGWPGGEAWINTQTLLARRQFIERALGGSGPALSEAMAMAAAPMEQAAADDGRTIRRRLELAAAFAVRIDSGAWLKTAAGLQPERGVASEDVQRLARQLAVVPPVAPPAAGELGLDALRALLLDPAYQLK